MMRIITWAAFVTGLFVAMAGTAQATTPHQPVETPTICDALETAHTGVDRPRLKSCAKFATQPGIIPPCPGEHFMPTANIPTLERTTLFLAAGTPPLIPEVVQARVDPPPPR